MAIPFNPQLAWESYLQLKESSLDAPEVVLSSIEWTVEHDEVMKFLFVQTVKEPVVRTVQFVRDLARLVLKVPYRSVKTPVWLKKNWKERRRAEMNVQLVGCAFVQMFSTLPKIPVAMTAVVLLPVSKRKAKWVRDQSEKWTAYFDGCAAQFEALKSVGRVYAKTPEEYKEYKQWLYKITPKACRGE